MDEETKHYKSWSYILCALIVYLVMFSCWLVRENQRLEGRNVDLSKQVEALKDGD